MYVWWNRSFGNFNVVVFRMFDCQELKLSKHYLERKLGALPTELTKEELLLKSKYEELRKAKEQLRRYRTTGSCDSPIKNHVIHKPVGAPKLKENLSKKTTDFKNWSKQAQGNAKRLHFCYKFSIHLFLFFMFKNSRHQKKLFCNYNLHYNLGSCL